MVHKYFELTNKFAALTSNIDTFVEEVRKKNINSMATDEWTVKDVLAHITFWHMNYAANYEALANNLPPPLLEGPGYKINQQGVSSLRKYSRNRLISMLQDAQKSLEINILIDRVPQM